MFNQTTSLAPYGESKTFTAKIRNGINGMSEKQVDRVQTVSMWIIGGLITLIVSISTAFTAYVVEGQNQRIAKLEHKYETMLERYQEKMASIDKNLALIAAKNGVDLK